MLIEHPTIYLDAFGRTTDALLIVDGVVVATGETARRQHTDEMAVVEPTGACLFPGLADAHSHLWGVGRRLGSVDLSGTASSAEVVDRLGDQQPGPSGWVLGRGWDDHRWPDGDRLTRGDLDAVFSDIPVCLHRVDTHAIVANSAALRRAGLMEASDGADAPVPEDAVAGGRVVRDADGRPTGLLVDDAMEPVLEAIPAPTEHEDRQLLEAAAEQFLDYGITSAHMARTEVDRVAMVRRMHADGDLPLRLYLIVDGQDDGLEALLDDGPDHDPDAWLSCRAVKFFADGALGSEGALLLDSYPDGSSGLQLMDPDDMTRRVGELMDAGWQVAIHAIGDRAGRHVLDAFEGVPPETRLRLRPRMEHAQMLHPDDLPRLAALSCIASIQPIHMRSDAAWADEVLGADQLSRMFRWADLAEHTAIAGGSDYPIEDPNPWHGIATAVSRRSADGQTFRPQQALDIHDALTAYTTGAAYAAHWEERLGQLRPGFAADIIALDRDPFDSSPDALWETEVLDVWLAGERQ